MELERLFRQFDGASFAQRAQLAAEAAGDATPAELDAALAGLAHAAPTVRLGVIELMRAARHRGAIARLEGDHEQADRLHAQVDALGDALSLPNLPAAVEGLKGLNGVIATTTTTAAATETAVMAMAVMVTITTTAISVQLCRTLRSAQRTLNV